MIIELLRPHTHAGKTMPTGSRLDLPDPQARWMVELGIAKPFASDKKSNSTSTARKEG